MRAVLYVLGCLAMLSAALGIALLPLLVEGLWRFLVVGALCSAVGALAWVAVRASAGDWVRPRTGWFMMAAGAIGSLLFLWRGAWGPFFWAALVLVTGAGSTFAPFFTSKRKDSRRPSGPVRPPLGRREQI